jgi:DNA-binding NarL/FixJ family response regulator
VENLFGSLKKGYIFAFMATITEAKILETKITPEDIEAIEMLASGNQIGEVSEKLGLKRRTLESRFDRLKKNLECHTTTQLVAFFIRNKIIE